MNKCPYCSGILESYVKIHNYKCTCGKTDLEEKFNRLRCLDCKRDFGTNYNELSNCSYCGNYGVISKEFRSNEGINEIPVCSNCGAIC